MLYKYQASDSTLSVLAPEEQQTKEKLDRSRMYELEVEFNPASEAGIQIENRRLELPNGTNIPIKIRTSDPSFRTWFQQACGLLGTKVYLIPDTNVIRRMYYTNYLRPILVGDTSRSMAIDISRLVVLEIESMYNRNKSKKNPPPESALKKKDEYEESEKRRELEIRTAFQSMGEILSMKNDGARLLPKADMSLINIFQVRCRKGYCRCLD